MDAKKIFEQGKDAYRNQQYVEAGELLRRAGALGMREALMFMAMKADELNNLELCLIREEIKLQPIIIINQR